MTKTAAPSKTPFEIRLELLQMAKDHMDATFKAQCDFATLYAQQAMAASKLTAEQFQTLFPKPYAFDEIAKKAAELYLFVQKKD